MDSLPGNIYLTTFLMNLVGIPVGYFFVLCSNSELLGRKYTIVVTTIVGGICILGSTFLGEVIVGLEGSGSAEILAHVVTVLYILAKLALKGFFYWHHSILEFINLKIF